MGLKGEELAPWDEGVKKKARRIGGLADIKTSAKAKLRCKPPVEGQEYLDLYLMVKEKKRLEKFGDAMGKMGKQTAERWKDSVKEIAKAEKNLPQVGTVEPETKLEEKVEKRVPKKPVKTMSLGY
ncbi:MAG: hypothetical protein ACE5JU_22280 [Candidatus Binatia bacterium]